MPKECQAMQNEMGGATLPEICQNLHMLSMGSTEMYEADKAAAKYIDILNRAVEHWVPAPEFSRAYDDAVLNLVKVTLEEARTRGGNASEIPSIGEPGHAVRDRCDRLEEENRALRSALHDAWTDLGQWLQLARYQRDVLDHNPHPCPSEHGINSTVSVREKISKALAARRSSREQPRPVRDIR